MIKINFFDYNSLLIGLSELYGLEKDLILKMVVEAQCSENPVVAFIEEAGIKLDSVDISQVKLHCKHIMTINDEFVSIKKYGLITLDKVLTYDTPLHNFYWNMELR